MQYGDELVSSKHSCHWAVQICGPDSVCVSFPPGKVPALLQASLLTARESDNFFGPNSIKRPFCGSLGPNLHILQLLTEPPCLGAGSNRDPLVCQTNLSRCFGLVVLGI